MRPELLFCSTTGWIISRKLQKSFPIFFQLFWIKSFPIVSPAGISDGTNMPENATCGDFQLEPKSISILNSS